MFKARIGNTIIRIEWEKTREEDCELDRSLEILETLKNLGGKIMGQLDELKTAVSDQTTAINDAKQRVAEDVATLQAKIEGAGVSDSEISALLENIKANTAAITTLDPVVDALPATPETPEITPEVAEPATEETPVDAGPVAGGEEPVEVPEEEAPSSDDAGPTQS